MSPKASKNKLLSPEARLLLTLIGVLFTIAHHQLLYHMGLVEDDVNEHYAKVGELYE